MLQTLLDHFEAPDYLEVGVADGATFLPLRAAEKVAVDPAFRFDITAAALDHPHSVFHALPSVEYFGQAAGSQRFDVIYLDGLHTFANTARFNELYSALNFFIYNRNRRRVAILVRGAYTL